jgi:transaldolase
MFPSFVQAAAAAQAGASVIQIFVGRLRVSIPFY